MTTPNVPPTETPSGEAAPAVDEAGTPPVDEGTPGSPDPDEPQGDEPPEGDPEPTPAEETAFAKLRAKYPNMSDDEFHETVADNYWSSTKEISSGKKRIQELEAALKEAEANAPEPEDEPEEPPPNPQLERLDRRIKTVYDRGVSLQAETQELLKKLPDLDKGFAKAEAREEDAAARVESSTDDYEGKARAVAARDKHAAAKAIWETKKENLVNRLRDLHYKREQTDYEMEGLLADKDWTTRLAESQKQQAALEKQSDQEFDENFPKYIDDLVTKTADALGAPKSEKIRNSLWTHVNRATTMDFFQLAQRGINNVSVPKLVEKHIKEYLEDRDLVGREKFKAKSEAKLSVTQPKKGAAAPPAVKPAVSVSEMGKSGRSPAMEAARRQLAKRNL